MAVETIAAHGWSSLPADLVNRVADCLLATNDLDCYTDLRAVCHHWRAVTADPRSNQHDPRFRPSRWVMLDEQKASDAAAIAADGAFLFVNTATGRYIRRCLLLLRDPGHAFITSTTGGLLVLAATEPPHAVSVLNPFTGSLLRFAAPLPSGQQFTAELRIGSSPALVLVSVEQSCVFWAEPHSESFSVDKRDRRDCPASRLPQIAAAGKYAAAVNRNSVHGANNIFGLLWSQEESCRCYAVVAAGGDMLAVLKRPNGMEVFKIDAAGNIMERMKKSIGSQALFLGVRCIVVDTDRFPTVEANCAYFQLSDLRDPYIYQHNDHPRIYKFTIGECGDHEPESVLAARSRPLTVTQFLSNYTMDIPRHPLPLERLSSYLEVNGYVAEADCYEEYIYYYADDEYFDMGCLADQPILADMLQHMYDRLALDLNIDDVDS